MKRRFFFNSRNQAKHKTLFAIISMLMLVLSVLAVLPVANSHTPPWTIPTYAYIAVSPNPIGLGQQVFIVMWIDKVPPTAGGAGGDRWQGFTVEVTKPDGTKDLLGPYTSDATSSTYALYSPSQVGTYSFLFKFPGQKASLYNPVTGVIGSPSDYLNDTYLASQATATLTVQQQPVSEPPTYPLPTSFWTRPIEMQNTAWSTIASNWLGGSATIGGAGIISGTIQPDGAAPNSAHVMWTKPLQAGGIVGGKNTVVPSVGYYSGLTYEIRFTDPVIIQGKLYYDTPLSNDPYGGPFMCVDLVTGQTLWTNNAISPTFGQLYDYESFNQHGVIPDGYLWQPSGTTWMAWDPTTGASLFNETGVPTGTSIIGSDGSWNTYILNAAAGWLAMWNNTAEQQGLHLSLGNSTNAYQWRPVGKTVNMSNAYTWNVTIPKAINIPGSAIVQIIPNDIMLGRGLQSAVGGWGTPDPYTLWAISLKPETRGQLLWLKTYPAPAGNVTRTSGVADPINRVFVMWDKETMQFSGYSFDSGNQVWGPTQSTGPYDYYGTPSYTAYGNLYFSGYGGVLYCVSMKDGTRLWSYGNGGVGNSTFSGHETPWGNYPIFIGSIADGKIYVYSSEHSPNVPLYKGARVRCIDAFTGKELWTLMSWGGSPSYRNKTIFPIADGYMVYFNHYDGQLYCVGKGPSATTVVVQDDVIAQGSSILIKGTVTDQSAGAKEAVQEGKFGSVPAMADESMGRWMEYLYMQKPIPGDAKGVSVQLSALDPNGNNQDIGTVTTDLSGTYSVLWTPPVQGKYIITATFAGTGSYWPSYAETAIGVTAAPSASAAPPPTAAPTPPPTSPQPTSTPPPPTIAPSVTPPPASPPAETPNTAIYIAAAAVVVVVAVVAAAVVLRRRK
ncbi:MAG: PQQ-binding-like beta-propeller repeat protein [Candidatus Bathyarchaeia archaeon]